MHKKKVHDLPSNNQPNIHGCNSSSHGSSPTLINSSRFLMQRIIIEQSLNRRFPPNQLKGLLQRSLDYIFLSKSHDPKTYEEASPIPRWQCTMQGEMDSIHKNQT